MAKLNPAQRNALLQIRDVLADKFSRGERLPASNPGERRLQRVYRVPDGVDPFGNQKTRVVEEYGESMNDIRGRSPEFDGAVNALDPEEIEVHETDYTGGRDAQGRKVEDGRGWILGSGDVEHRGGFHR